MSKETSEPAKEGKRSHRYKSTKADKYAESGNLLNGKPDDDLCGVM